jgi:hypothetical protein
VAKEIVAMARSLKTNVILTFVCVLMVVSAGSFSETMTVLIVSPMKGFVPILTTIANFGTVQNVLVLYWQNINFHLIEFFKYAIFSLVFP